MFWNGKKSHETNGEYKKPEYPCTKDTVHATEIESTHLKSFITKYGGDTSVSALKACRNKNKNRVNDTTASAADPDEVHEEEQGTIGDEGTSITI